MKKAIKLTLAGFIMFISFAFIQREGEGIDATFGVSDNDPSKIELKLNKDYTFTYQDLSDANNIIKVQGTYALNKNKVILKANDQQADFHNKWKIASNESTAKSSKGLSFYSLCKK